MRILLVLVALLGSFYCSAQDMKLPAKQQEKYVGHDDAATSTHPTTYLHEKYQESTKGEDNYRYAELLIYPFNEKRDHKFFLDFGTTSASAPNDKSEALRISKYKSFADQDHSPVDILNYLSTGGWNLVAIYTTQSDRSSGVIQHLVLKSKR